MVGNQSNQNRYKRWDDPAFTGILWIYSVNEKNISICFDVDSQR